MSLEAKIEELTRAVEALTAKLTASPVAEAKASTPKPEKQKASPSTGTTKESPESAAPSDTGARELDWKTDIGDPFLKLYAADQEKARELVAKFGVAKLSLTPKERWPEVVEALKAAGV